MVAPAAASKVSVLNISGRRGVDDDRPQLFRVVGHLPADAVTRRAAMT
jgi:hypothetical protein